MGNFLTVCRLEIQGALRSKWFWSYAIVLLAAIALIFASGISDSRVSGFTGLSRVLLIFIQACNLILPVFILVSTVRTLVKEKENSVFEYLLSFPVTLPEYYFAKFAARVCILSVPLIAAMALAALLCLLKSKSIPFEVIALYTGLLLGVTYFYVSLSFLISSVVKSQETGLGAALLIWLLFTALLDVALLGLLIKALVPENVIYALALCNPAQLFKIAAISLFDPVLSVIGPAAFFILDMFGRAGFLLYTFAMFMLCGTLMLLAGYFVFSRKDML